MPDAIISVDLQVNSEKALQTVDAFKKDAEEKISSIGEVQAGFTKEMPALDMFKNIAGFSDSFNNFVDTAGMAASAINQMKTAVSGLVSAIDSNALTAGMTRMFEASYRTIMSSIDAYQKEFSKAMTKNPDWKGFEGTSLNMRTATATGLSAARNMERMLGIINNRETGLSSAQLGSILPALYSVVRSEADSYIQATKSTPKLDDLSKYISEQKIFKDSVSGSAPGSNLTNAQMASLAKLAILSTRSRSIRDNLDLLDSGGFKKDSYQFVVDQLPEVFAKAYKYYGKPNEEKTGLTISQEYGNQKADSKVYAAFRSLVKNGNQQAIRAGLDVGLLRAKNGKYYFSDSANMAQMDTMAGLVARSVGEAKSSLPYYFIHRNNAEQQEKLLGRQNNIFQDSLELMEVLSKQKGLDPNIYGYVPYGTNREDIKTASELFRFNASGRYNNHAPKIATLGTKDQYVVPKTRLDESGNLIWRDPSWIKSNGVQEKTDDHFATITNSAFTQMLGLHGNNTYGYGRDEDANPIYGTPKVIRLDTSYLYKQFTDKNGSRMIIDPEKEKEAERINRIFARKETLWYGKPGEAQTEYITAFGDAGSITLMQKNDYDNIVNKFLDKGMANPFDNMNTGGLFISGDYENASKQIDMSRKKATPGNPYSMFGYNRQPSAALVDFKQLYNYLGVPDADSKMRRNERIDGVALFDPSVLGVNAQMRAAFVDKFMGQTMDWRKLLSNSGLLDQAYLSGKNRGLITLNPDNVTGFGRRGYSFYMPQVGLDKVDLYGNGTMYTVSAMIEEMNALAALAEKGDQASSDKLDEIREKYFFDIMSKRYDALLPESVLKNNDKFRIISKAAFTNNNGLFKGENWARDRGDGTVELTADQQKRYFEETLKMTGGYWINNTGYDFRTNKDYIPESLAMSMGANVGKLKEESTANYAEYISKLETDENARIAFLQSTPMGRRLIREGRWNDKTAQSLIQSHINDVVAKQENGDLFLPEYGIDNLLTGVMPGSIWGNIFERGFGVRVSDNSMYRNLFQYSSDRSKVFMDTGAKDGSDQLKANAQFARLMLSRMPAGPGEYSINPQNLSDSDVIRKALDAIGADYSDTVFTDPSLQFKLMTGDYDGDTAWVIRGLSDEAFDRAIAIQNYVQKARERIQEKLKTTDAPAEKRKLEDDLKAYTNFGADHGTAQIGMGLATAAIRNAMADLSDDDPDKWIAIAEGIDAYDRQTSEAMKKGEIVRLGSYASKEAKEGALFRRFVKQINAYSNGSENVRPNLFSTRLPEIRDLATLYDIEHNFIDKKYGKDVGRVFGKGLDDWLYEQYGSSTSYEAQAARFYGNLFKNIESGNRLTNQEDIYQGRLLAVKWGQDIEQRRAAGFNPEQIAEEEGRLNSFVKRLQQQEESKSLREDFLTRIEDLKSKRDNLLNSGISETDKQIEGLNKTISLYENLTRTPEQAFSVVAEQRKLQKAEWDDVVKKRVEDNIRAMKAAGMNLTENEEAILGPALSTDLLQASGIDWSSVTPWVYSEMQKDKYKNFKLTGIGIKQLPTARNGNSGLVNINAGSAEATFFPYPHDVYGISADKYKILAREMDQAHDVIPAYTDTISALMGSYKHTAFEHALKEIAKGHKDFDIAQDYEAILVGENNSAQSRFKALGLGLSVDDESGEYKIENAKREFSEDINNALGIYNKATKKYEGGILSSFINNVVGDRKIVNVEGANLDDNGIIINTRDLTGHGVSSQMSIANGSSTVEKGFRFSPDAILQNADNTFTMVDYKSGSQGAMDALFQMLVYAKDVENKAKESSADQSGWSKYIDKNTGRVNFKNLLSYDTSTGQIYDYSFDPADMDEMFEIYQNAIGTKLFDNAEDKIRAEQYLRTEFAKKYGLKVNKTEAAPIDEVVRKYADEERGPGYSDILSQKFAKDEETLHEIQSNSYRAIRKYGNVAEGGFSQFAGMRRQLNDTLDDETISNMIQKAEDAHDQGSVLALLNEQQIKRNARKTLDEAERLAVQNGFNEVESYMLQQFYGVEKPSSVQAYDSVRKRILDTASIREGWKENGEVFKDGQWISKEYELMYQDSIAQEEEITKQFKNLLPTLRDKEIKQNNTRLKSLLNEGDQPSAEETIENFYAKRFDAIEQYVKQQESNLAEYNKKLEQKDAQGKYVLGKNTIDRNIFEELKANAISNLSEAQKALIDKDAIREAAQRDYEKTLGLSNGEKTKTRSQLQAEYLQSIKDDYDLAQRRASDQSIGLLNRLKTEAEITGNKDNVERINKEIQDRLANLEAAKKKLSEYDDLSRRYEFTKEIEGLEKESTLNSINSLFTGKKLSHDQIVAARYVDSLEKVNKYKSTLSPEELKQFEATHSNEDLWKRIEEAVRQEEAISEMTSVAREEEASRRMSAQIRTAGYSTEDFARQRRQSANFSMFDRNYAAYENRAIQLSRANISRQDAIVSLIARNKDIDAQLQMNPQDEKLLSEKKINTNQIATYNALIAQTTEEINNLTGAHGAWAAAMDTVSQALGRLAQRLGRQLFNKALQEAKKFIREFDASMTEIQMISLKTDKEMEPIREQTINKAITMKTSVSNVASVESALYRQGLSDEEVSTRTDDIIKFSKVAGVKVEAATKILTTALQNNLVSSAQEAMDALVALGDSAATTAEEIGKAMQKCAASAKVAGVSYSELTAIITTMTSMTQLSGTQIGTALNSILTRMHKVTTTGIVKDINGESTSLNDVESALKLIGIDLRTDKKTWAPTGEVLLQIAQRWSSLSDINKSNVSTAIGGSRIGNMFQTLMEGMSEDNGETFAKYLGLAENSEGVTESKYEIAIKSINSSLEELRATYDSFVESLQSSKIISGGIELITSLVSGLTALNDKLSGVASIIATIGSILGGFAIKGLLTGALSAAGGTLGALAGPLGIIAGIVGGGLIAGGASLVGNLLSADDRAKEAEKQKSLAAAENVRSYYEYRSSGVEENEKLVTEYTKLSDEEKKKYDTSKIDENIEKISGAFPELAEATRDLTSGTSDSVTALKNWTNALTSSKVSVDQWRADSEQSARNISRQNLITYGQEEIDKIIDEYAINGVSAEDFVAGYENITIAPDNYTLLAPDRTNPILNRLWEENPNKKGPYVLNRNGQTYYGTQDELEEIRNSLIEAELEQATSRLDEDKFRQNYVTDQTVASYLKEHNLEQVRFDKEFFDDPRNIEYLRKYVYTDQQTAEKFNHVYSTGGAEALYSFLKDDSRALPRYHNPNSQKIQYYSIDDIKNLVYAEQLEKYATPQRFGINTGSINEYSSDKNWDDYATEIKQTEGSDKPFANPYATYATLLNTYSLGNSLFFSDQKDLLDYVIQNVATTKLDVRKYGLDSFFNVDTQKYNIRDWLSLDRLEGDALTTRVDQIFNFVNDLTEAMSENPEQSVLANLIRKQEDALNNALLEKFDTVLDGYYSTVIDLIAPENGNVVKSALMNYIKENLPQENGAYVLPRNAEEWANYFDDAISALRKDNTFIQEYSDLSGYSYVLAPEGKTYKDMPKYSVSELKTLAEKQAEDEVSRDLFGSNKGSEEAYKNAVKQRANELYQVWQEEISRWQGFNSEEEVTDAINDRLIKKYRLPSLDVLRRDSGTYGMTNSQIIESYIAKNQPENIEAYKQSRSDLEAQVFKSGGVRAYDSAENILASAMQYYSSQNKDYKAEIAELLNIANSSTDLGQFLSRVPNGYNELEAILQKNPDLLLMANSIKGGETFFEYGDFVSALNNAFAGTNYYTPDLYSRFLNGAFGRDNMSFYQLLRAGQFGESPQDKEALTRAMESDAGKEWIAKAENEYNGLSDILTKLNQGLALTKKEQQDLADVILSKGITSMDKYGDSTEEVVSAVLNLNKGGKTASAKLKTFNQSLSSVMNNQYYRNAWRSGKRDSQTLESVASMIGVTKDQMKELGDDAIESFLQSFESADIESIQINANAIAETMSETLTNELYGQKIVLNGMEVDVNSGNVVLNFDEALAQLGDALTEEQRRFIEMLKAYKIQGEVVVNDTGKGLETHINITGLGSGYRGGGGGGGGKSATDKLIESQKHRVDAIQHENTMLEIETDNYARANNIEMYESSVQSQIDGQEKLRAAYKENISELKQQMKNVKEGTDDWYKLVDALNAAEEAYAKIAATIDELSSKVLQEVQQQYEFESNLVGHREAMIGIENRTQRRTNNYTGWRENIAQRIAQKQAQIVLDKEYALELRKRLGTLIAEGNGDSDLARQTREELNKIVESMATLDEDIRDLGGEVVELNNTIKANAMITPEHMANVYSAQGEEARRNRNWRFASAIYDEQAANLDQQRQILQASIARNRSDLENTVRESTAWYEILQQIYSDEEALLQLTLTSMDLELQRIEDVKSAYEELFTDLRHSEAMYMNQAEIEDYNNNYSAMFANLNAYTSTLRKRDSVLARYIDQLNQSLETAETEEARLQIVRYIQEAEEERQQIEKSINDTWAKRLSAYTEKHERELAPIEYQKAMLGYEETRNRRLNDYEAVLSNIEEENSLRRDSIATLKDQRAELEAEQRLVAVDSDAWWNLQKEIENVTKKIEEDTKAIDDNNKKRLEALQIKQQNEDKPGNYAFDIYSLAAERAQLLEDNEAWEGVMKDRLEEIRTAVGLDKTQVAEAEALLATYVEGSEEWIKTRDLIWTTKKDIAQKENEALKIEQQIDAQRLAEIQKEAARRNAFDNHEIKMLDIANSVYQSYGNYDNYRTALEKQYEDYEKIRESSIAARDAVLNQMATLEKGTTAWYNARDAVYAYDEAISSATNTMLEKQLAIEASRIQELTTNFNDSQLENNAMLQIIRSQKQAYDNANDFENFQRMGQEEKKILDQQIEDKKVYLNSLKELLKETTVNTNNWYNLRQNIAQTLADIANMETQADLLAQQQEQSVIEHMLEKMNYEDSNRQHNLTLIQHEQTKYQNAGELSNYGIMLEKENKLRQESIEANERDIATLKAEQDTLEKGSKEYNQITEAIKKKEEAIKADTVAIEKNTKAIEENANAIQKTRKDLEDTVEKEIKTREEERKKMLKSEIDLQNTILETIKQRYKDEWNLEQEDINKKKEALEKEKSLINERLKARKNAMEIEDRYRELEELQRQLALISNDPTRTKDAKELREQIRNIEKDISWDKAFEEAEAATQQIDDEIQALNDYVTVHGDNLEEMLQNANNFTDQIELIMSGGWESISNFLTENNEAFKNSMAEAQRQMLEGWEQTWKDMNGIIDTYWDQIAEILSSYETFVEFMKDSTEYINSSEAGKAVLQFGWEVLYDNWVNSGFISPEATNYQPDEHPWYDASSDLTAGDILGQDFDWLNWGKAAPSVASDGTLMNVSDYNNVGVDTRPHAVDLTDLIAHDTYTGVGITKEEETAGYEGGTSYSKPIQQQEASLNITTSDIEVPDFEHVEYVAPHVNYTEIGREEEPKEDYTQYEEPIMPEPVEEPVVKPEPEPPVATNTNNDEAKKYWHISAIPSKNFATEKSAINYKSDMVLKYYDEWNEKGSYDAESRGNYEKWLWSTISYYKNGGLADYTGLAWVDGTPSKPEAFLDAEDTKMFQNLTAALTRVSINSGIWPGSDFFGGGNTTFGNINVTINQAELKDGADFDDVARRVGKAITKEMSKKGYNMTGYNL